jgi:glycine/D-amino acid oxidase-like deaminating enzyme
MSSFRKDASGRLLIGSIGRLTDSTKRIHERWAGRKLRFLFPDLNEVKFDHSWDGRIAMTNDHLPKIVQLGPDGYSVFGFSGRGIGPGTVFGQLAADSLLQREEDILPLVPIDRHTNFASRTKSYFIELGATALHLIQGHL